MKGAYNYTAVETHKQKLFIPYLGIELQGWSTMFMMLGGLLIGIIVIGYPASLLLGSFGYIFSIGITGVLEMIFVAFATEIDRESRKNKLITFFYRDIKKYRVIYDSKGRLHKLSGKKEGVRHRYVC